MNGSGQAQVIETVRALRHERGIDVECILVGGADPIYKARILRLIGEFDLQESVSSTTLQQRWSRSFLRLIWSWLPRAEGRSTRCPRSNGVR
jgi:hypothetical protein